jgi:hypothetical protein
MRSGLDIFQIVKKARRPTNQCLCGQQANPSPERSLTVGSPNIHPGNGIDGVANSVDSQKLSDFTPKAGIVNHSP